MAPSSRNDEVELLENGRRCAPFEASRFVMVKRSLITAHASHFAGGKHAFYCMASTLAAAGHDVHVVTVSERPKARQICHPRDHPVLMHGG